MSAAAVVPVRAGEPFNPWRGSCGFYPPDVVWRLRDPLPVGLPQGGRASLTDGQKGLFERLVRFAGNNGRCYPSHERLAVELGKSARQIRRDLVALEEVGLIRWRRRGRQKGGAGASNYYEFLWHPIFDRTSVSAQKDGPEDYDRTLASDQSEPEEVSTGHPEHYDRTPTVILTGHMCPPNSVHEFSTEKSSSLEETDTATPREATTTTIDVPSQTPNAEPKPQPATRKAEPGTSSRWWTAEQFDQARQSLLDDFRAPDADPHRYSKPDAQITRKILAMVSSVEDWHAYLEYRKLRAKQTTKRSYGFYLADVGEWLENRETLDAEVAEVRAERERNDPKLKRQALYPLLKAVAEKCDAKGWKPIRPHLTPENDPGATASSRGVDPNAEYVPEWEMPSDCVNCAGRGQNPDTGEYCHCPCGESARRQAVWEVQQKCNARGFYKRGAVISECLRCAGTGRDHETEAICTCAAGKDLADELDRCPKCGKDGVVTIFPELHERKPLLSAWCTCHHAERLKAKQPDCVDQENEKARQQFEREEKARQERERKAAEERRRFQPMSAYAPTTATRTAVAV